jgi:uncharacterized RDD family membrane protein YckC
MDEPDRKTVSRPAARSLFAEFGVRVGAIAIDLFIVMYLAQAVQDQLFPALGLGVADHRPIVLVVMFLYFTACWVSPLRATPVQFLLGMRVVDEAGETLSLARVVLRSAGLVVLFAVVFLLFRIPVNPYLAVIALAGYALLFLAAVTPNRQAAHDFLAHSLVVNRSALKSPERRDLLREHVADKNPASRAKRRPSAICMMVDALVLGVPVYVLFNVALIQYDRDLVYRTGYAMEKPKGLKTAIEIYHQEFSRWPDHNSDLGIETRADYPDGGYYELEDGGGIRIRFTVIPDLMKGSIVLSPMVQDEGYTWVCRSEGGIARNHLPAPCRD